MPRLITTCLLLVLPACAAPTGRALRASPEPVLVPAPAEAQQEPFPPPERRTRLAWEPQHTFMQGFLGVSSFEKVEVDGSGPGSIDGDRGELDQIPLIGGGGQWKLGGERVDLGLESMLSFSWRGDAEAFVVGGGGAAVAIDVDLLLFEIYGGPFASAMLGEKLRVYGAAGPLFQFADYSQSGGGLSDDGSGFGVGWYARTGFEFVLPSRVMIGLGARWSDSTVDLDSGLGDLDIEGLQGLITVTRGY